MVRYNVGLEELITNWTKCTGHHSKVGAVSRWSWENGTAGTLLGQRPWPSTYRPKSYWHICHHSASPIREGSLGL